MKIGLIDVDSHNYPNLPLMKIAAWHKAAGDEVEWHWGWGQYDKVYMSKVFDDTYSADKPEPINAGIIIKGGTGYFRRNKDGNAEVFVDGQWRDNGTQASCCYGNTVYWETLPGEIEKCYPDYSLYPDLTKNTAYGFLTRGCPNNCGFCIVSQKEGRCSWKVADLDQWWNGQKNIVLCDPNLLACREHMDLLRQLEESNAWVDVRRTMYDYCYHYCSGAGYADCHSLLQDLRKMLPRGGKARWLLNAAAIVWHRKDIRPVGITARSMLLRKLNTKGVKPLTITGEGSRTLFITNGPKMLQKP